MAPLWIALTLISAFVFAVTGEFWFALRFLAVCWLPCFAVGGMKWSILIGYNSERACGLIFGCLMLAVAGWICGGSALQVLGHNVSGFAILAISAAAGLTMPFTMPIPTQGPSN
jgi:hypothetical protein